MGSLLFLSSHLCQHAVDITSLQLSVIYCIINTPTVQDPRRLYRVHLICVSMNIRNMFTVACSQRQRESSGVDSDRVEEFLGVLERRTLPTEQLQYSSPSGHKNKKLLTLLHCLIFSQSVFLSVNLMTSPFKSTGPPTGLKPVPQPDMYSVYSASEVSYNIDKIIYQHVCHFTLSCQLLCIVV